jgi:uncharacterized protein
MARNGMRVIDVHHHVGTLPSLMASTEAGETLNDQDREAETRLAVMDANGIDAAIVIPGHEYLRPRGLADTAERNNMIARYRDRDPSRFIAAVGITEPLHGAAGIDEVTRCAEELGVVGISLHTYFQGVATDSALVSQIVDRTCELGLVPFLHAHAGAPDQAVWKIAQIARRWPDATLIALDAFSGLERVKESRLAAELSANLVFDTALAANFSFVEAFIADFGPERVVFGTDLYSHPFGYRRAHVLDDLMHSSLSEEARRMVLSGNIARILQLVHQ